MPNQLAIILHGVTAPETASGVGAALDNGDRTLLDLTLETTVVSGTSPALTVLVEKSITGTEWLPGATFPAVGAVATKRLLVPSAYRFVRARWTIGGATPSFTFAVTGTAHQLYCEPEDIAKHALPKAALDGVPPDIIAEKCLSASDEAAGYLDSAFNLPLVSWATDLRKHVACMAGYELMRWRGYQPDSGKDDLIKMANDDAIKWLNRIANGQLRPTTIVDSTPELSEVEVYVACGTSRGWNLR